MDGKWNNAPAALKESIRDFEGTLTAIHEFMQDAAQMKWYRRVLSKSAIESALTDYGLQLEEAWR
ncbi:hypothetical protein EW146_g10508, partial [Bondarzewia mesenterica]